GIAWITKTTRKCILKEIGCPRQFSLGGRLEMNDRKSKCGISQEVSRRRFLKCSAVMAGGAIIAQVEFPPVASAFISSFSSSVRPS
ncbi:MAG: hypothetical protein CMG40_05245, partial [Candidatus Marinimicrobia bacterium]|nr:hypothetical protein [Candidatus Neomarinimicrobiota bacterium]